MVNPRGLTLLGDYLLVCDNGIKIYNKANAPDLTYLRKVDQADANDLIAYNNFVFATSESGLYIYKFENENLIFLSKINTIQS